MKMILASISIIVLLSSLACTNIEQSSSGIPPTQSNPNGDSELALLMREMFEDGMRMKSQIEKGAVPEVLQTFESILTAKATEPEKAASNDFKIFAKAYLNSLKNLKTSSKEGAPDFFHGLVESCMNCHRAMCPGPMVRIDKLYLKK